MPNTHSTLTSLFGDIADAIRAKTGDSGTIVADAFPAAIEAIPSGGSEGIKRALNATRKTSRLGFNIEKEPEEYILILATVDGLIPAVGYAAFVAGCKLVREVQLKNNIALYHPSTSSYYGLTNFSLEPSYSNGVFTLTAKNNDLSEFNCFPSAGKYFLFYL